MSNQFLKLRRSSVPGKIPDTGSLALGEIALNTYDGLAFMKKDGINGEEIVVLGNSSGSFSGSFSGQFTGSLLGTASWAYNAATASTADNFYIRGNVTGSNALFTGTITAQKLVVQTVSSSVIYSSGSNIFGDELTDTQQFTGSVSITGSLKSANAILSGSFSGSFSGNISNIDGQTNYIAKFDSPNTVDSSVIYQSASHIAINETNFTAGNPEALYVFQTHPTSINVLTGKGNLNNYLQNNIQNTNQGVSASSDVVATANNGNEDTNYIDMGINSQNFNTGFIGDANDAYLYSIANNLHVGNANDNGTHLGFFVGGSDVELNNKLQLNPDNRHRMSGSLALTGSLNVKEGITGSLFGTSSWAVSASFSRTAISSSNAVSASYSISSSFAVTSSFAVSASNSRTASFALSGNGGFSGSFTGSFFGNGAGLTNISASSVVGLNLSLIGSGSVTASTDPAYGFRVNSNTQISGSTQVTGSLGVTGSFSLSGSIGSLFSANVDTMIFTGSLFQSGSIIVTGSVNVLGGVTASLFGTSSWAVSASHAPTALTSSNAVSASYALTSSYGFNALTASTADNFFVRQDVTASNALITGTLTAQRIVAQVITSSTEFITGSTRFGSDLTNTHQFTGSVSVTGSLSLNNDPVVTQTPYNTFSQSIQLRATNLESTASILTSASASFAQQSGSNSIRLANLETTASVLTTASASFSIVSSSFASTSASISSRVRIIEGNYATTGSNVFRGSQTIQGNLFMSGSFPLIYNNDATNNMLFGMFDGSTIYGPYYQLFGNQYSNISQRGSAEFVYDTRNGGESGFNIASFNGSTWTRKFRVDDNGAQVTGSLTAPNITGSLFGTSSWAVSASHAPSALTSSNAVSASYALTSSFAFNAATASTADNFFVRQNITASNGLITGTLTAQTLVVQTVTSSVLYSSGSNVFGNQLSNTQQFTGSVSVTGSLSVNNSPVVTNATFTPVSSSVSTRLINLESTASVLTTASASFAIVSASYSSASSSLSTRVTRLETTASVLTTASASFSLVSSSYSQFSQSFMTGSFTGSFTGSLFGTASFAISASYAPQSLSSVSASYALTASNVNPLVQNVQITGSLNVSGSQTFVGTSTSTGTQIVTGSLITSGSNTLIGNTFLTGSVNITGSTVQIGNNSLLGNTTLSGSIIISGSQGVSTPTIKILGDIEQTGYTRYLPVTTNLNTSISASYIFVSGSTEDLYFSQNSKGYSNTTRLRWLEGNLYTGLLNGGLITTQSSTVYQVASGSGIVVNLNASINDNPYPTVAYVNWPNLSASIAPLSASYDQSFIAISSAGSIVAQGTPYTDGQIDTQIPVGVVLHQNRSTINGVTTQPSLAYGIKQRDNVFISAFGPLKLSGYTLAVSGSSTGSLVVANGTAYLDGGNYQVDPNNPSYITGTGANTSRIFRYRNSGSAFVYDTNAGAGYNVIDPAKYSNNGVLTSVGAGNWSIQRVFFFPTSPLSPKPIVVYYGNAIYSTEADAIANIPFETFSEAPNTSANAIYLGAIVISGNGVFTNTNTYKILPGGLFRQVGGSGGGGSTVTQTLSGLSDVNISGPTDLQPLAYSTTAAKWINTSTLNATITGNAATATTASYALTASFVQNAQSASYVLQAVSSSYALTASFAANVPATASYALQALSSSFASTASFVANAQSASYVLNAVSASFATTSSFAQTASFVANAQSASYVLNAISASFAATASSADNFLIRQNATASNLLVNNTITAQTLVVQTVTSSVLYSSGSNVFGNNLSNTQQFTGSVTVTGSLSLNNSPVITNATFTPVSSSVSTRLTNLESTASVLTTASASFALVSASYSQFSQSYNTGSFTGSFIGALFGTASWANNATTASFVISASYAQNVVSASFAATASLLLGSVTSASFAATASSVNTLNQNVLITGSLTIGSSSLGSNENTLVIGPSPSGGTGEGGQILLQATGGTYTSASMLDTYQDKFRILRGTNAASDAAPFSLNLHTGQLTINRYTSAASFPGSVAANLAVDSSGNVLTIAAGTVTSASFAATASIATSSSFATSASFSVTSSFATTSSFSISSSFATSASFSISSSFATSASFARSSSFATTSSFSISSSFATTASFATSASFSISSSFATSASFSISSSFATSASFARSASFATTSSFSVSASYAPSDFPFTGSAIISGSLAVSGSVSFSFVTSSIIWSTAPAMNAGSDGGSGVGTQTAALKFGGFINFTCTEAYNGSSWSAVSAMNRGAYGSAAAGTQNSALKAGGTGTFFPQTETYNGISWTNAANLINSRNMAAGAGASNTAALAFGGYSGPAAIACTEAYNGTSWSAGGAMITARCFLAGAGTQNAALAFGGGLPNISCTETYDGATWSTGGALITGRRWLAGAGTQNSGLAFGGTDPAGSDLSCTEAYNGSTWSSRNAMNVARSTLAGAGASNTSALAFGGFGGPLGLTCTEAYGLTNIAFKTFDYSNLTGNISATGSLFGTASLAQTSVTSSYVLNAVSASFATSASIANQATTASYTFQAVSASYALTSSNVQGGLATYIPLWDTNTSLSSSYLNQSGGTLKTIYNGTDRGLTLNYSVDSYILGNPGVGNSTYLQVFDGGSVINVYSPSYTYFNDKVGVRIIPTNPGLAVSGSLEVTGPGTTKFISTNVEVTGSLNAPIITGSLFGTSSWAENATTASYAATASTATTFRVTNQFIFDGTLTDYATVASSIVGSNNLFTQASGSYTSAFFKYTAANGTNARSGEVMAVWNAATVQFTDNSTLDVGSTTPVTCSVAVVGTDVQFNVQTNTSGWRIKSIATFM